MRRKRNVLKRLRHFRVAHEGAVPRASAPILPAPAVGLIAVKAAPRHAADPAIRLSMSEPLIQKGIR
jgi:hypothetical protein